MKNEKFFKLIKEAKVISIMTHNSPNPDIDAVSSGLLTLGFIEKNFSGKDVVFNAEIKNDSPYSFLVGYEKISHKKAMDFLLEREPDLIIVVDTNNWRMVSRENESVIRELISLKRIKSVIIDHHPLIDVSQSDVFINNGASSAAEEVFRIFTEDFGLDIFDGAVDIAMFGILSDTNRFFYSNKNHRQTFKIVSELLDRGAVIEKIWEKFYFLNKNHAVVLSELLKNFQTKKDYNYSFISDDFVRSFIKKEEDWEFLSQAFEIFTNQYLRYIGENVWGFAVIPDFIKGEKEYRGSFRAINDLIDVSVLAREFGGGGHKSSSGFSLKADNYLEAIEKIESAIEKNRG